jgi:hypothetical protein
MNVIFYVTNAKILKMIHMKINFLDVLIANLIYVLYVNHYMIKIMQSLILN